MRPLNYLIRLDCPDLLHAIYGRVLVPQAVLIEMLHPEAPAGVRAWAFSPPAWLETVQVRQVDTTLAVDLGAGEREAISLAIEVQADVLLIDERIGRREAEARHIEVAGTLAVLLQASLRGHLNFPEVLQQLRSIGFRISETMETSMLARHEQAKKP